MLSEVGRQYGLLTISEILDPRDVQDGAEYLDIIQIGSRNMSNYALLKEVGKSRHPVLLKRGYMSTISEYLLSAEYIAAAGNTNLILCERGIRSFDNSTRNLLDISGIALIQKETSLCAYLIRKHWGITSKSMFSRHKHGVGSSKPNTGRHKGC